jgi:hypothetical protein
MAYIQNNADAGERQAEKPAAARVPGQLREIAGREKMRL